MIEWKNVTDEMPQEGQYIQIKGVYETSVAFQPDNKDGAWVELPTPNKVGSVTHWRSLTVDEAEQVAQSMETAAS